MPALNAFLRALWDRRHILPRQVSSAKKYKHNKLINRFHII